MTVSPAPILMRTVLRIPNSSLTNETEWLPADSLMPIWGVLPIRRPSTNTFDQGVVCTRNVPSPPPEEGAGAATAGSSSGGSAFSPPPATHTGVVAIALRYLGVPYVWGGASPSGFDCSGLTMYAYAQVGVYLPHNAAMQYGMGHPVAQSQLEPGDLVFFNGLSHVGMYIGGGRFVHAPHTGDVVKISSLSESWYASTYVGARRY